MNTPLASAAQHLIATAINDAPCQQVLWVSDRNLPSNESTFAQTSATEWSSTTPDQLLHSPWQKRHDLAVTWLSASLSWQDALHVLSALRDLHARQLLAFVPANAWSGQAIPTQADQLRALGLQQQACLQQDDELIEVWSFDIRTYKTVPDWLNPRFWANPENWNKYRW